MREELSRYRSDLSLLLGALRAVEKAGNLEAAEDAARWLDRARHLLSSMRDKGEIGRDEKGRVRVTWGRSGFLTRPEVEALSGARAFFWGLPPPRFVRASAKRPPRRARDRDAHLRDFEGFASRAKKILSAECAGRPTSGAKKRISTSIIASSWKGGSSFRAFPRSYSFRSTRSATPTASSAPRATIIPRSGWTISCRLLGEAWLP